MKPNKFEIAKDSIRATVLGENPTHLNLIPKDRKEQYKKVSNLIRNTLTQNKPLLIAGDFSD